MVRMVPEPQMPLDSRRELKAPEGYLGDELERAKISNTELVQAFGRYAEHTRGDFKAVFEKWIAMRVEHGYPVDARYPEETRPTGRFRKQYQQAFEAARSKQ